MALVLGVLALIALANLTERVAIEVAALAGLLILVAFGVVPEQRALSGFSDTAVWLVVGMMVVAAGVRKSGLIARLADLLTRLAHGSPRRLKAGLTVAGAATGALLESTAAMTALIPVVGTTVSRIRRAPQPFYVALALGAMAGGLMTLIGTSGNIVADAALVRLGQRPLGFFELLPLGLGFLAVALTYSLLARGDVAQAHAEHFFDVRHYVGEVRVTPGPLVGKTLAEASLFRDHGIDVVEVERDGERFTPAAGDQLQANDRLLVSAPATEHLRWSDLGGLEPVGADITAADAERLAARAAEVMLPPESSWVGRSPRDLRLRQRGVQLLGIWRQGSAVRERPASITLRTGDLLLVTTTPEILSRFTATGDVVPVDHYEAPRSSPRRVVMALLPLALFLALAIPGIANLGVAALAGAALALVTGVLTPEEAYAAVEWRIAILLGAVLPVAASVSTSGLARTVALFVARYAGSSPLLTILAIFVLAGLLTQVVSNIATAAVLTPVAVQVAHATRVPSHALVVTLLAALMVTPLTGAANKPALLVMSEGVGRRDYWTFGLIPSLAGTLVTVALVLAIWRP
jgi:di/tricarboxylate transporter